MSVVFFAAKKEQRAGVPTIVSGELLAVDLVTIPSNRDALVMSSRSFRAHAATARTVSADALMALARAEVREARRLIDHTSTRGTQRRRLDDLIRQTRTDPPSTAVAVHDFLRRLS